MKDIISTRWLANPNCGRREFPHDIGAHMNILFSIKVKILMLIRWLYRSPIMLTAEPRMESIF